jgi:hypothetical protein
MKSKTVPVQGIVSCDGKPLTTGTITFRTDAAKGNTAAEAFATIEEDGSYTLRTRHGSKVQEGAAPGWYRVGVVSVREPAPNAPRIGAMPPPATPLIPIHYADPATSGISIEVNDTAPAGTYDIKLQRDKKVARR